MKIHLRKKKSRYAQVHQNLLRNVSVSMKAKGLGSWLELHEDGFEMTYSFIISGMKEGKEAIHSAVTELKKFNFLHIEMQRDKKGLFVSEWYFDSEGIILEDYPYTDNPYTDNPSMDKSPQNIKHKQKKEKQKISSSEGEDYESFRKKIKKQYLGNNLVIGPSGYLKDTTISISGTGYLYNEVSGKDLDGNDAIKLWTWLYCNQSQILPDNFTQKS